MICDIYWCCRLIIDGLLTCPHLFPFLSRYVVLMLYYPCGVRRPELSAEEKQRNFEIGRRYNSKMGAEHNARMADFTMKIKLRDDAIAHLPEMLQHAARQKDRNPPPLNRRMASYTPPIPNFNPDDYGPKEDERDAEVDRFS